MLQHEELVGYLLLGGVGLAVVPLEAEALQGEAEGDEAGEELGGDMEDILTFMHCCLASACQADGIPFTMDVQEMADHLDPSDVTAFAQGINGADGGDDGGEKKKSLVTNGRLPVRVASWKYLLCPWGAWV